MKPFTFRFRYTKFVRKKFFQGRSLEFNLGRSKYDGNGLTILNKITYQSVGTNSILSGFKQNDRILDWKILVDPLDNEMLDTVSIIYLKSGTITFATTKLTNHSDIPIFTSTYNLYFQLSV